MGFTNDSYYATEGPPNKGLGISTGPSSNIKYIINDHSWNTWQRINEYLIA